MLVGTASCGFEGYALCTCAADKDLVWDPLELKVIEKMQEQACNGIPCSAQQPSAPEGGSSLDVPSFPGGQTTTAPSVRGLVGVFNCLLPVAAPYKLDELLPSLHSDHAGHA